MTNFQPSNDKKRPLASDLLTGAEGETPLSQAAQSPTKMLKAKAAFHAHSSTRHEPSDWFLQSAGGENYDVEKTHTAPEAPGDMSRIT